MFSEKYKPHSLAEFVGQRSAVNALQNFMKTRQKKALLLHGPAGTGKTSMIEAYAADNRLELLAMNASDERGEEQVQRLLGAGSKQASLFRKSKIILVDEIDGIAGREDSGGIAAVIDLVKKSSFPVVLIANNPWNQRLKPLRQHCMAVEFKRFASSEIQKKLKQIADAEGMTVSEQTLAKITKSSKGDMRSAINNLEISSKGDYELDEKEVEKTIFELMGSIFKAKSLQDSKASIMSSDIDPQTLLWWLEGNIVNEHHNPESIAQAYETLSKADLFFSRIRSKQNWRLLAYATDMMASIASNDSGFVRYQSPMFFRRQEVDPSLPSYMHCSTRKIRAYYIPLKLA